jgi:hypothetical protein
MIEANDSEFWRTARNQCSRAARQNISGSVHIDAEDCRSYPAEDPKAVSSVPTGVIRLSVDPSELKRATEPTIVLLTILVPATSIFPSVCSAIADGFSAESVT